MRTPRSFTLKLESNFSGLKKYSVVDRHGMIVGSVPVEAADAPALEAQWNGPKALDGAGLTLPLHGGHRSRAGQIG
jgi:hypothetical protein